MTWFIFSLLSIFALATAELTQQKLLNKKEAFSERTSAVLTFLFQSILTIPIIFLFGLTKELFVVFSNLLFLKLLLVNLLVSFGMIYYLKSFRVKNISFSTIFVSLSTVVSTTLGIIFYKESTNLYKFLGIFLVLFAIFFYNYKNTRLEKNHYFGILAGIIFGIAYTIDKTLVQYIHPIIYIFYGFFLIALFGFALNPKEVEKSIKGKSTMSYLPIAISGIGYFLYNFFTFTSYTVGGEVGRVDAINNSQIFLIILFEYFVLKHTKGTAKKLFSAIIAFVGVLILGLT